MPTDAGLPVPVRLLKPAARLPERAYEHDAAYDLYAAEEADARAARARRRRHGDRPGLAGQPGRAHAASFRTRRPPRHLDRQRPGPDRSGVSWRGAHHPPQHRSRAGVPRLCRRPHRATLFLPLTAVSLAQSDTLDDTHRGERGFGSSGMGGGSDATRARIRMPRRTSQSDERAPETSLLFASQDCSSARVVS